jgi:hypothetical protein
VAHRASGRILTFASSSYEKCDRTIIVRHVSDGLELARSTVRAKFG